MNNEILYDEIFKRQSVRRYQKEHFIQEKLDAIQEELERFIEPLVSNIKYEYFLVPPENVKNPLPFPGKAPHYICFFSEKKEGYLQNAGYIMQQISLYLSANKIGSCYMGAAKLINVPTPDKMELVMIMCFGNSKKSIHRNYDQFKRKTIDELTDISGEISGVPYFELLEAAKLAPSARNEQNYIFKSTSKNKISIFSSPDKKRTFNPEFDCGIALYHIYLAAKHYNLNTKFDLKIAPPTIPAGYIFTGSIKIY